MRILAILAAVFAAGVLGITAWMALKPGDSDQFAQCRETRIVGGPGLGGPFTLTDETGSRVTSEELLSKPTLLYFGFTYCPDVCPLDSARNADAVAQLRDKGYDIGFAMITIDPARDTPELMAEFTSYFDDDMIGLTGSEEEIAKTARAFRVYYAKNGEGEDYLMDHSTMTYLVGTDAKVIEIFRRDHGADAIAASVGCFLDAM